jgi:hypothetical protein
MDEATSTDMFAELMDNSADKMAHARNVAMELLEMANDYEDRAEKLRHLAALMILEAQSFAEDTGTLLAMEFPMGPIVNPEGKDEDEGLGEPE